MGHDPRWQALLDAVRERSRATHTLLGNVTAHEDLSVTLVLTVPTPQLAQRLNDERNVTVIRGALRDVLGEDWQVAVVPVSGQAPQGRQHCVDNHKPTGKVSSTHRDRFASTPVCDLPACRDVAHGWVQSMVGRRGIFAPYEQGRAAEAGGE